MNYIDVIWTHALENEPVRFLSELDEARIETRKLELFQDGSVEYATEAVTSSEDIALSYEPIPSIEEINRDTQFKARDISQPEFDALWNEHVNV